VPIKERIKNNFPKIVRHAGEFGVVGLVIAGIAFFVTANAPLKKLLWMTTG
jgi:hypothetical protein